MATDLIRYDLRVQDALRGVVRDVLMEAARNGLQGEHHFFITFKTNAPGLRLSNAMRERYPDEMTVILQHQFWELSVTQHAFEVGLSFSGRPERLLVPFAAITSFVDPSVEFGLKFDVQSADEDVQPETPEPTALPQPAPKQSGGKRVLAAVDSTASAATGRAAGDTKATPAKGPAEEAKGDGETKVVSIDAFRKKP